MTMSDEELRRRVSAAYDEVLDEPVPGRLSLLLAEPKVIDLDAQRAKRTGQRVLPLTWTQLGGIAAGVLVGIAIGWQIAPDGGSLVSARGGTLVAGPRLAHALDQQLASDRGDIAVQLSFVDREGRYCRTFSAREVAGLACREPSRWSVLAAAQPEAAQAGAMRQAASPLPRPVLDAVDAQIAGAALDAASERQARDQGWRK